MIFWCWRDEVFGPESSGFGLIGADGHAQERLAALKVTGDVLERHAELLDGYVPDPARVGVLFEESAYHLDWAQFGASCEQAGNSVLGYLRALELAQVPYEVVDSGHLDGLDDLGVLIMAWPLVVAPAAAERIGAWVEGGGTLLVESELGAYDESGFYHYPAERELATRLGVRSLGRRPVTSPELVVRFDEEPYRLGSATWVEVFEPGDGTVLARVGDEVAATMTKRGDGTVISVGTFLGLAYSRERTSEFERFVRRIVDRSGATPKLVSSISEGEQLKWRLGTSGARRLLFLTSSAGPLEGVFQAPADVIAPGEELVDLIGGSRAEVEAAAGGSRVTLGVPGTGFALWSWR